MMLARDNTPQLTKRLVKIRKTIVRIMLTIIQITMTGQIMANENNQQPLQTVCVGRLLIDLPATARIHSWGQRYQGHILYTIPNVTFEQYQANVKKRVAEWQAEMQWKNPVFDKVERIGSIPNAVMITKWTDADWKKLLISESYYWVNGTEIISKEDGEIRPENLPKVTLKLEKLFSRIKHLAQGETPEEPGFCMDGAWIPRDGSDPYDWEQMDFMFELTSNPDVQFWLASNTIANKEPLLARNEKNESVKEFSSNIHVLRQGEKNIGPFKGQELDHRFKEFSGVITHSLNWESIPAKSSNALDPLIRLEAKTGYSPKQEAPINSSLKDDELLKIWDQILNSIRLRPTSAALQAPATIAPQSSQQPLKHQAPLRNAAIGTRLQTEDECPQSGYWQCIPADAIAGDRHYIRAGQPFPPVRGKRKLSIMEKMMNESPMQAMAASWTLVSYD